MLAVENQAANGDVVFESSGRASAIFTRPDIDGLEEGAMDVADGGAEQVANRGPGIQAEGAARDKGISVRHRIGRILGRDRARELVAERVAIRKQVDTG